MVALPEFHPLQVCCRPSLIAILDYGSGNLRSAERAFATTGHEVVVTADRKVALEAAGLVIPGVGAFAACMSGLTGVGGDEIARERISLGRPTAPVGQYQAWSEYGEPFLAAVEDGALTATQFHPEKSGNAGLKLIANWSKSL